MRDYLPKVALADLGCAILGVYVAAQLCFGDDVTLAPTRGYDTRFIGTCSDEFRKVLNAGVSLTAAIVLFMVDEECRGVTDRFPSSVRPEPLGVSGPLDGCSNASTAPGKIARCPSV